ncbi:hypothetical protein Micbo1qcDRAFT_173611 [Microdochium bolleyi]|uniref:DUF7907 domain-containing protein n=1 Tax=Microdochium bolleyi TaxID=196109 RepID=A0A136JCG5_9PEZI|nr:hypothetical protein Micbo1qcDRAFT_173611 [Microdochium bolleyi]
MQFTISNIIIAGLAAVATAAPTPDTAEVVPQDTFFLVVQSQDDRVNGRCASPYHTGAGLSDTTIQQCGPAPPKDFQFADSKISYLNYGNGISSNVRANDGQASYDSWASVVINAGDEGTTFTYDPAAGFLQEGNGLGFIACTWAHAGAWQLFALSSEDAPIQSNCAAVTVKRGCYNVDPGCVNNTW